MYQESQLPPRNDNYNRECHHNSRYTAIFQSHCYIEYLASAIHTNTGIPYSPGLITLSEPFGYIIKQRTKQFLSNLTWVAHQAWLLLHSERQQKLQMPNVQHHRHLNQFRVLQCLHWLQPLSTEHKHSASAVYRTAATQVTYRVYHLLSNNVA